MKVQRDRQTAVKKIRHHSRHLRVKTIHLRFLEKRLINGCFKKFASADTDFGSPVSDGWEQFLCQVGIL